MIPVVFVIIKILSILGSRRCVVSISLNTRSSIGKVLIIFYQVKRIMSIPLPRINPKEREKPNPQREYYEEDEEEW
jgi:hypothetical protein